MKVILAEDVPHLGEIGELVNVKSGYARNFLYPRKLAVEANDANIKELEHYQRVLQKKKEKKFREMKELAKKIEKISIEVAKQVGDEDRIFGSVTAAEIEHLLEKKGVKVSRKQVVLPDDIKKIGTYSAEVVLHKEIEIRY